MFIDPVTMARDSADSDKTSLAQAIKIAPIGVVMKHKKTAPVSECFRCSCMIQEFDLQPANFPEFAAGQMES